MRPTSRRSPRGCSNWDRTITFPAPFSADARSSSRSAQTSNEKAQASQERKRAAPHGPPFFCPDVVAETALLGRVTLSLSVERLPLADRISQTRRGIQGKRLVGGGDGRREVSRGSIGSRQNIQRVGVLPRGEHGRPLRKS